MKKKVIFIAISVLIFCASIGALVLYNIGDMIVDSAIESALSVTVSTPSVSPVETILPSPDSAVPSALATDTESVTPNAEATTTTTNAASASSSNADAPEPKQYTVSEIEDIKNSVSVEDKFSMSKMVLNNLTKEDIDYLTGLMSGGLTAEEKAAAKSICYARFSAEEIGEIYSFYKAYTAEG